MKIIFYILSIISLLLFLLCAPFVFGIFFTEEGLGMATMMFLPMLWSAAGTGFLAWVVRMAAKVPITRTWRNIHNINLLLIVISIVSSIVYIMNQ